MESLEDKLKRAMQRVDAPNGFEARLMARIAREQRAVKAPPSGIVSVLCGWLSRPAVASGMVGLVVLGLFLGGLSWEHHKSARALRGEQAKAQLLLALRITADCLARVHELLLDGRGENEPVEGKQRLE